MTISWRAMPLGLVGHNSKGPTFNSLDEAIAYSKARGALVFHGVPFATDIVRAIAPGLKVDNVSVSIITDNIRVLSYAFDGKAYVWALIRQGVS